MDHCFCGSVLKESLCQSLDEYLGGHIFFSYSHSHQSFFVHVQVFYINRKYIFVLMCRFLHFVFSVNYHT